MIGKIAKGYKADLLVIDPEVFADNADFSGRSEFASGLWRSMIGEFAVKDDALTSAAPASFYTSEQGQVFARDTMLNMLSVLKAEIGIPSRSAVGMNVLPGNLPIEIEAIFELCE